LSVLPDFTLPEVTKEGSYRIRLDYPLFENEPQRAQSSLRREPEEIKVKRGYICGFGINPKKPFKLPDS
jgi:hypothetical protein